MIKKKKRHVILENPLSNSKNKKKNTHEIKQKTEKKEKIII